MFRIATTSSPSMSALRTPKIDRWQSRYPIIKVKNRVFMALDSLLSPSPGLPTSGDDNSSITNNNTTPSSPASSTTSTSSLLSRSRRTTLSSLWDTNKRVAPSPRPPVASTMTTKPIIKTHNKKICPECNKSLSGKTVRLPDSSTRYHWECLKCTFCREPFENTSFYTDNANRIYHPKCSPMTMSKNCLRCSTEINDAYLVIHNRALHPKCFRCTSCQKVLQPSTVYTDAKTAVYCQPCSHKNNNNNEKEVEHSQSTATATRQTKIVPQLHPPPQSYSLPITDSMDRLSLAPSSISGESRTSSQTSSPITSSPGSPTGITNTAIISSCSSPSPANSGGVVKPSSLMSRRGRPLPKFGLRKICAGCTQKIISVHEEKPGPRATRWHKKCLSCSRCSKVLDSAAVVHENATTGGLDPWCTICLVSNIYIYITIPHCLF
ncbi:hypothetical protein INT45_005852 [Circinella minor]|uniref:LIM zinc-binding domain-containing protein n=1 Tax=Circinella minor TaxID=1195481 RepID=A0A8H7RZP5_9FUNG|nr:hypothetical protein INT45_005852 [Circinella minor]